MARRFNALGRVRKIIALTEIYGTDACSRAIDDARVFNPFSSEYMAHLLVARAHLGRAANLIRDCTNSSLQISFV
jgi:hypothetical protein